MAQVELPTILNSNALVVLPETKNKGTVVALSNIGQSCYMIGDIVLFPKKPKIEVEIEEVTHLIIKAKDILGWYYRVSRDVPEP